MAKKDKQQKQKKFRAGETAEFEDLSTFEQYLKDEREDNDLANAHAHIQYFPPFVLAESHNDPERIKDCQNRKNKKFVRHLHQHVEKHLLTEIKECSGMDLRFGKPETIEDFDTITWKYMDASDHGMGADGNFKVQVVVKCDSNGAAIDVKYDTIPMEEAMM
jgi:hypothetical protein